MPKKVPPATRSIDETVNYPKVIDHLTDVIKELNVGFAPCGTAAPAAPSEEQRRADAVGLLKALLGTLEQGPAAGAAAEHGGSAQQGLWDGVPQYDLVVRDGDREINSRRAPQKRVRQPWQGPKP